MLNETMVNTDAYDVLKAEQKCIYYISYLLYALRYNPDLDFKIYYHYNYKKYEI
jgi:hypothetical protein